MQTLSFSSFIILFGTWTSSFRFLRLAGSQDKLFTHPTDTLNYPLFNPIFVLSQRSQLKLSDEWTHRAVKTIRTRPKNTYCQSKYCWKTAKKSKHCVHNILWTIYIGYISRENFQKQQSLIFHVSCQQEQKRMKILGAVRIKSYPLSDRLSFFPS